MALTFINTSKTVTPVPAFVSTFDYTSLDKAVASAAINAAHNIRTRLNSVMSSFVQIGEDLIAVKQSLPHGEFRKWCAAEFDMTPRTAANYMNAAGFKGNFGGEIIEALPQKIVYQLASFNAGGDIAADIIETLEKGDALDIPDIAERIKIAREANAAKKSTGKAKLSNTKVKKKSKVSWEKEMAAAKLALDLKDKAAMDAFKFLDESLGSKLPIFAELYLKSGTGTFRVLLEGEVQHAQS